jgi:hypothetical protein
MVQEQSSVHIWLVKATGSHTSSLERREKEIILKLKRIVGNKTEEDRRFNLLVLGTHKALLIQLAPRLCY